MGGGNIWKVGEPEKKTFFETASGPDRGYSDRGHCWGGCDTAEGRAPCQSVLPSFAQLASRSPYTRLYNTLSMPGLFSGPPRRQLLNWKLAIRNGGTPLPYFPISSSSLPFTFLPFPLISPSSPFPLPPAPFLPFPSLFFFSFRHFPFF